MVATNSVYCKSLPAQVEREVVLLHQTLLDHVVEYGLGTRGGNAGEGQAQNAIRRHVGQEGSLGLAQAKHLIGHLDASNLQEGKFSSVRGFR